jgi:hypothetical protein
MNTTSKVWLLKAVSLIMLSGTCGMVAPVGGGICGMVAPVGGGICGMVQASLGK